MPRGKGTEMGGSHAHAALGESRELRRLALLVIAPVAVLAAIALALLWPGTVEVQAGGAAPEATGTVLALHPEECPPATTVEAVNGCGTVDVRLDGADGQGEVVELSMPYGPGAPVIAEGDDVVLIETGPDGATYDIVDHQRGTGLLVIAGAFALAMVAFGRWRGLSALVGLAVTFALLVLFVVPAILEGRSPVLIALVGSAVIALTVLYLTHGFALSTTVALIGTLGSLLLTGVLAWASVHLLHLTGITDDVSTAVGTTHSVNMQGLLLAGIVIGSLGVLDDVTVTQAATVTELAHASPSYRFGQLYRAGSRVGRAHIASVVNTIVLAYAGSSLPLIVLIVASNDSLGVVTTQVIAQEIVRSAVATLGLVAAVPITTALAALVARHAAATEAAATS